MKRMTVPAFLATAVLAFSLTGCSSAQSMTEDTLKGVWALESGSDLGITGYISFEDDNAVEMILADGWLDGTYSVSGTSGSIEFTSYEDESEDEGEGEEGASSSSSSSTTSTAKLTYSNNKLTLGSSDGSKLVFVKDDSEETKGYFEFDSDGLELANDGDDLGENRDIEIDTSEYVDEVINPIDPVTVADDAVTTITVTGKGTDFTGDPGYQLSITNKTDKSIYLIPEDDFTVGDKKVEAGLGEELEPGEALDTFVYFAQDDLGGQLDALGVTDGVILVLDDATDDELARYTFHME